MKNVYLLLLIILLSATLNAQIVGIADVNFKAKLIALGVDANNDGKIQLNEALQTENLDISNSGIASLSGIASFSNLKRLNCNNNNLTSLSFDISNLYELRCSNNKLTEIENISSETKELDVSYNELTNLDLPSDIKYNYLNISGNLYNSIELSNLRIENFYCNATKLTSLDFSNVKQLSETISIKDNSNLKAINFKNNKFDLCYVTNGGCHFYLIISGNPVLKYICADEFDHNGPTVVTEVEYFQSYYNIPNISYNTLCSDTKRLLSTNSETISTEQNFTFYPNPLQNILNIEMQNIVTVTSVRIFNTVGQLVKNISKPSLSNHIEITISDLKTGTYIVQINSNSGTIIKKLVKI